MGHRNNLRRIDVRMEFIRSSGPGGQHKNKRFTGVRLSHVPTGVVVTAVERREQALNRELAWERLEKKVAKALYHPPQRRETKPSRASIERRIENKKKKAQKKYRRIARNYGGD